MSKFCGFSDREHECKFLHLRFDERVIVPVDPAWDGVTPLRLWNSKVATRLGYQCAVCGKWRYVALYGTHTQEHLTELYESGKWREAAHGEQITYDNEGGPVDNQHKHIKGYRDLTAEEIALMNRVKEAGAALLALQAEVAKRTVEAGRGASDEELARLNEAEPWRWASIAKTDIQTGIMALVRAIAQPGGGV